MKSKPILYIVIPCYNEQDCLPETTRLLDKKFSDLLEKNSISSSSKIIYIDDGSKDKTWKTICSLGNNIIGLKLAHNRGHQNALLAGLMYAKDHSDVTISMDADLQDDINVIDKMLLEYRNGSEIVYGVRNSRKKDSFFKRFTAQGFYKFMHLLGVDIVYNSADCRLMSKRALNELERYNEVNLFLRGIVPLIGFRYSIVEYERGERFAGESKYPLKKMLNFAWDGITSFSVKPLRIISVLGIVTLVASLLVMLYALIMKVTNNTVSGWTFVICSIWLVGGLQMISIGIIGEYIGKIYAETKKRPRYCIEEIVNEK